MNKAPNTVYLKRFVYSITSKSKVTPEDYIAAYETWIK